MSRSPPLHVVLVATLLVLVPVASAGAAASGTAPAVAPPATDDPVDRRGADRSLRSTQSNVTVLNVTVVGRTAVRAGAPTMVNVTRTVAEELALAPSRVRVDRTGDTVEVRANRSDAAIIAALREAGVDTADVAVRRGVTNATRDAVAAALRERIAAAGLESNTTVTVAGDSRLRIRTTAAESVRSTATARGDVALVGGYPGSDGPRRVELVDASSFANVGAVQVRAGGPPFVPVTLTEEAARNFSRTLVDNGFTDGANTSSCRYDESPDSPGYCIFTVVDGEVVYAASLSPGLAETIRDGGFAEDPQFIIAAANESTARRLATALRTGPLPAPVRVVNTTTVPDPAAVSTPTTATASATPTPVEDGTPTPTRGATPTPTAEAEDGDANATGAGGPGFGALVTLVGVLALAAGLAGRRQSP